MARDPEFEPIYRAYKNFEQQCIIDDRSIFWPERRIWNQSNIFEFKQRFIEGGIPGKDLSFEDKLEIQLRDADHELWGLTAELFYVYYLPSDHIKPDTKYRAIQWAARHGMLDTPQQSDPIFEAQSHGYTRTSRRYHGKFAQFHLLIEFALQIKENPNRQEVLENPLQVQNLLDSILQSIQDKANRGYDMRHAILYMAFPDKYERIISTRDKQSIIDTYKDQLRVPVPEDIDKALLLVREAIAPNYPHEERPFDFYKDVKSEWKPPTQKTIRKKPETREISVEPDHIDPDLEQVLNTLQHSKNVILYGPPGTGKTYIAKEAAEALITPQLDKAPSKYVVFQKVIEDLTFHEILALSMYMNNDSTSNSQRYLVPDLAQHELIQTRFITSPVKHRHNRIWGSLQSHSNPDSTTVKVSSRTPPYIFDKDDQSQWWLIDEGIDYVTNNLTEQVERLTQTHPSVSTPQDFVSWATFHQSYSYEDFVEGLRPVISEENTEGIAYQIVPGVFRQICTRASQDPYNQYVLIIDEINRGNIAKIMGELITLLEEDKRKGQPNEISVQLPYSQELFTVPANLYVIGTMNTADRSIALLDVALRRRFAFVEILPRSSILKDIVIETEEATIKLDDLLENLNEFITKHIDSDHQIGHSYLMGVVSVEESQRLEKFLYVWKNQIYPLLEEYFYRQREKLNQLFTPATTQEDQAEDAGNIESDDDLIYALMELSKQ